MKRIFITLFAVLTMTATLSAQKCINLDELRLYAQKLQVDDNIQLDTANGLVLEHTLSFPDKIQDELYAIVSYWVETNYDKTADTTISITNFTHSNISAQGHVGYLLDKKGKKGFDVKPNLTIEISDGLLTVKQYISKYEIWNLKETSFKFGGFSRYKSIKATSMPKISQCYPFEKENFFFKTEEQAMDALKICIAYEDRIVEEINSVVKNSK